MIHFLWAKNVFTFEIHSQIVEVYDEEAMSRQHITKWCHSFKVGKKVVENYNRGQSIWSGPMLVASTF